VRGIHVGYSDFCDDNSVAGPQAKQRAMEHALTACRAAQLLATGAQRSGSAGDQDLPLRSRPDNTQGVLTHTRYCPFPISGAIRHARHQANPLPACDRERSPLRRRHLHQDHIRPVRHPPLSSHLWRRRLPFRAVSNVDAAAMRALVSIDVTALLPPADRARVLDGMLRRCGVPFAQAAPTALPSLRRHHPACSRASSR
jgi:hypothetical protein